MGTEKTGKIVTIYDIADEAGVSTATVSRVLSNSAAVKQDKKDRVLALVEKYHYKPNALARGLVDTKSKIIGIITADITNLFYSQLYAECEEAAQKRGYTVMLCNTFGAPQQEEKKLEKLLEQRVDAIIIVGGSVDEIHPEERFLETVKQISSHIPIILNEEVKGLDCHVVRINAEKTMDAILQHLQEQGHKKIAFLGGRDTVISTYRKYCRYKKMLDEDGMTFDQRLIGKDGTYDWNSGYDQMNELYKNGPMPTAVIAVNDFAALGVIRSIVEHGDRIPEDIAVVSCDNTYIAQLYTPKLTSIDYGLGLMGEKMVDTAINVIEGRQSPLLQNIEPTLIIRESSKK